MNRSQIYFESVITFLGYNVLYAREAKTTTKSRNPQNPPNPSKPNQVKNACSWTLLGRRAGVMHLQSLLHTGPSLVLLVHKRPQCSLRNEWTRSLKAAQCVSTKPINPQTSLHCGILSPDATPLEFTKRHHLPRGSGYFKKVP